MELAAAFLVYKSSGKFIPLPGKLYSPRRGKRNNEREREENKKLIPLLRFNVYEMTVIKYLAAVRERENSMIQLRDQQSY